MLARRIFPSLRTLALALAPAIVGLPIGVVVACDGGGGGGDVTPVPIADAGPGATLPEDRPLVPASKVDLLVVVDNSNSMGDKASRLGSSLGTFLREVARVGDVHVGVVSSSLGTMGGDVCSPTNLEANGGAHLRDKGPGGAVVPGVEGGVLRYSGGDPEAFVRAADALVRGVGEQGCGFEAQLETTYRFLAQPDPWLTVRVDGQNLADLGTDVDETLLAQRKAFLRPDSALVVVMITDEDDSSADPRAVDGQGWAFMAKAFPGSNVFRNPPVQGTTAARGTAICATEPNSASCLTCGLQIACDSADPACQALRNDPSCKTSGIPSQTGNGYDGFYGPDDDELNVRFFRMKPRFGVDPQFPMARYIDGLTKPTVPNRAEEHPAPPTGSKDRVAPYAVGAGSCTNPIFAADLPADGKGELCKRERGPRSRELVLFALIGGVPEPLVSETPDWVKILGKDPAAFDSAGIDPHMLPSITPREGLGSATAPKGDNGNDPIHGREWDTRKADLQYACTFPLDAPRACAPGLACDCSSDSAANPPLCDSGNMQTRGKAYPTVRPLRLVQGLGDRGVFGSICAPSYEGTLGVLSKRLASRLAK